MNAGMQVLRCLAACSISGFAAGTIAAAATAQTTDSVQTPGQVLVLTALLGSCFAIAFAAAGAALMVGLKLQRARTSKAGEQPEPLPVTGTQLALVVFLLWGGVVGGLWLHDMALGNPLPNWLFRPILLIATVAAAWFAGRSIARSPAIQRVAATFFPVAILGIVGAMIVPRAGAHDVVEVPPSTLDGKVLLIGLDGADWERMTTVAATGTLPTLSGLIERSYRAPLETLRPTYSPIIWTTVMSGTKEYDHGIHRFTSTSLPGMRCGLQGVDKSRRLPPKLGLGKLSELAYSVGAIELRPISGCHRRKMNLWNILSDAGRSNTIVNWYVSWPADPINGSIVSDYNPARAQFYSRDLNSGSTGQTGITHPESLLVDLASLDLPPLEARPSETLSLPMFQDLAEEKIRTLRASDWMLPMFRTIHMSDVFSSKSMLHLLDQGQTDFSAFYLSGIDNVSHRWSKDYPTMVDRYYEWVDGVLAQVLEKISEDTTIVIVSDHGWHYGYKDRWGHGYGPDGVLMASGPGITPGDWSESEGTPKPTIYDVAPTILSLFGMPAAEDMPGRVLPFGHAGTAALARLATYGRYQSPPLPKDSVNDAGADETMQKLKALGYLD